MKTTKLTALFLAIFVLFSGCVKKTDDTSNTGDGNIVEKIGIEKYAPVEGKEYKITWTAGQTSPVKPDAKIVKYFNEKFNIKLDIWNMEPAKYEELLALKFASGEVPDLIRTHNYDLLNQYVKQDVLTPITGELIEAYAPNLYKEYNGYEEGFFNKYGKSGDNLYGIPQLRIFRGKQRLPIVYRGDWMKKVGVDKAPETLEEFETLMYKFAKEDPDGNGKDDTYGLSVSAFQLVYGAFGYTVSNPWPKLESPMVQWEKKDGKLVFNAVQPEMKEALALLQKWYKDGIIDKEFITGENSGTKIANTFITGRIGVTTSGLYFDWTPKTFGSDGKISVVRSELDKINPSISENLIFGLPPVGPGGQSGVRQEPTVTPVMQCFGKQLEEEPDRLGKILQFIDQTAFTDLDVRNTAYYGFKGEDWEYGDYKTVVPKSGVFNYAEISKEGGHTQLIILDSYTLNPSLVPPRAEREDKTPTTIEWLEDNQFGVGGHINQLPGTLPSQSKYKTELEKIQADAYIAIITGEKPIEYFDEFVKNWRAAGGAILEEEAKAFN